MIWLIMLVLVICGILLGWHSLRLSRKNRELRQSLEKTEAALKQNKDFVLLSHDELSSLMSAISDAILAVDLNGNLLFYNSRFALLFGGRQLVQQKPGLQQMFQSPEVLNAFTGVFTQGRNQRSEISLTLDPEGNPYVFSLSVAPLTREDGSVYGAVGIFHDVTELKRVEQIRIDFVANVSHELRTPLTSIKGYVDTLEADVKDRHFDDVQNYISVITRNVERLMSLIHDLLDLSSLESSDKFEKKSVEVKELTERVLQQLQEKAAQKEHQFEVEYGDAGEFQADSRRLEQVLVNLLENAIKYVPRAGRIKVKWRREGKFVYLHTVDNGPGIPKEHHARLFERFYRIDRGRSRDVGGTGLGLAIVKHIVQRHGGTVRVQSEMGQGTEFICEFPTE